MKKLYSFKWFQFNLNVECTKCGNNIVFQEFSGNPVCNECGNENKFPWTEVLSEIGVMEVPRGELGNRKLIGGFSANANAEPAEYIDCYHCKSHLLLPDDTDTKNFNCTSCSQPLSFYEYPQFKDLIFYRSAGIDKNKDQGIKPIAVRCVSCGAPLTVDPTKNNFTCEHCNTDNILPMSMRYKVVLADIFVADRKARYPKLFAFEKDGKIIQQVLREDGKGSFQDGELDKILTTEKNDLGTFNMIFNEYKYRPSDKVLNEVFSTSSNPKIIEITGSRLQLSQDEIDHRIKQVNPDYKKNKKETPKLSEAEVLKKQVEKELKKADNTGKIIMIIVIMVVIAVLVYVFALN